MTLPVQPSTLPTGEPEDDGRAPTRVLVLEGQIREFESAHAQLIAYAEDLNHTYQESRIRLQQMAELSGLAASLVRARNVEASTRLSLDGLAVLFRHVAARLYLEEREGKVKLLSSRSEDSLHPYDGAFQELADQASRALGTGGQGLAAGHRTPSGTAAPFYASILPLATRAKPFGLLVVGRAGQAFNEHESRVLELLAYSTAVAIENARLFQENRRLAITDPITRLYNVRHFRTALRQEIQKARRFRYSMAVIMADIDHFKQFNDTYGHPKGNDALQLIARALLRSLRQTDTIARYGGEEFAAILPGCDRASLEQVSEKIRRSVGAMSIRIGPGLPPAKLTISVGGAWQDVAELDAASLLETADQALYRAKDLGRDRSCIWP